MTIRGLVSVALVVLASLGTACSSGDAIGTAVTSGDPPAWTIACGAPATRDVNGEPNYTADYLQRWETYDGCDVRLDYVMTRTSGCINGVDDVQVGWPIGRPTSKPSDNRMFVRDPNGVMDNAEPFDPDAALPVEARDSGLRWDGYALWVIPGQGDAIWLKASDHVERWPHEHPAFDCL